MHRTSSEPLLYFSLQTNSSSFLSEMPKVRPNPEVTFSSKLKRSDIDTICELVNKSGTFDHKDLSVFRTQLVDSLKNKNSHYLFQFIRDPHEHIIALTCYGEIALSFNHYDLYWLIVSEDYRRHGLGKILLQKTEKHIASIGGDRLYIETSSLPGFNAARNLYNNCGYREIARLVDYYAPGDDKVIFEKAI